MPIDFFEGQRQVTTWGHRVRVFRRSSVFKRTTGACLVLSLYVVVGHLIEHYSGYVLRLDFGEVTLLGAVLSLLLVLRTNLAYDRWWEGRKMWGQLVNDSRNLSLKVQSLVDAPVAEKAIFRDWVTGFPYCLRDHLRSGIVPETLALLPEQPPEDTVHVPAYVSGRMFRQLRAWRDSGQLNRLDYHLIDQHVTALMNICGACERIRNTPAPLSHRAFIPQLLGIYLVITPLGMQPSISSALLGLGIAYFLIGIEVVAEEIEEPFGYDSDDLPLDTISTNIKRSVLDIFAH